MREPGAIENDVLIGLNGYLFLAGGAHRVFEIVTGQEAISELSYDVFRKNIERRKAWAGQNSAQFVHVVMPDKQSIIPEEWPLTPPPLRVGAEYIKRMPDLSDAVIYPVNPLSESRGRSISRVDTHMSDYGSILVSSLIVEQLSGESQASQVEEFIAGPCGVESFSGDLGSKLDPPMTEIRQSLCLQLPGPWFHNGVQGGNNGIVDLRFNANAPYQKRVVLFGDSFGREIARFLHCWYKEVLFFRSGYFHEEIATACRADIVLTENVERYLDNCQSDDNASEFFEYPIFGNETYGPSEEFSQALSAIFETRDPRIKK